MNIFGFFLFLRFHTYYKSADDIKNIRNKLLSVQVTLLMFSSILVFSGENKTHFVFCLTVMAVIGNKYANGVESSFPSFPIASAHSSAASKRIQCKV